ncbi:MULTISPECIES: amidohydrolase [unclassified Haladaptatus]|uniref:amidohydrolase n=1 Tax=unclassified Haladaptatus TaxID=2622732 RepID=UPI00209BC01C|nr:MULTISPECIES: amidohydrolase [unclassified Haladaptatus]MCO8243025.1 amidohydrolase [Haladaptatus sp. AB643]MCO8252739.1 amidohydrolase [Haladaptatus sp. AB618]
MTAPADLILTNAEVHTLADDSAGNDDADDRPEAVAVRDGEIVRVDSAYEVNFLNGVQTEVIDLGGRVLLPGFIDAHTHMQTVGSYLVNADLSDADSPADCVDLLAELDEDRDSNDHEWVLGYGFDESMWDESRYLTREDLDSVSETRPVAAFREDLHVASVNGVVLDRLGDEMPEEDVETEDGEPTGVIVEDAVNAVYEAIEPDAETTRELLLAAQRDAHEKGVTGVHDMCRQSRSPVVYRRLELEGDLTMRVRINYWSDHIEAAEEVGLVTNHGSSLVTTGAIKSFTDGSFGGRTAKLLEPYADAEEVVDADADDVTGQWVVSPEELDDIVTRADGAGFQVTAHAIGDEAIEAVLDAFDETGDAGEKRHRVEHVELVTDEQIERFAESGVIASVQPNFLKWAQPGGLYDARLGEERRKQTNRYRTLLDAGAHLAFGSDCMPLDPLLGIHQTVNAPVEEQQLSVTEALRAYTLGAAYAGFDEDDLGTVEVGKRADFTVLDRSPWKHADDIENIDVAMTVVDGVVAFDGRND